MSWVQKELRKRQKVDTKARESNFERPAPKPAASASGKIDELWAKFESVDQALPADLKLARVTTKGNLLPPDRAMCSLLLQATNGSAIGLAGDAIRYVWPEKTAGNSYNFWIRWLPDRGYVVSRRRKASLTRPAMQERAFQEASVEHVIRCLVTNARVRYRSVAKRRLWLF